MPDDLLKKSPKFGEIDFGTKKYTSDQIANLISQCDDISWTENVPLYSNKNHFFPLAHNLGSEINSRMTC